MRTLIFTIKNPAKGDLIVVEYSDPRGGCTAVDYTVIGPHMLPHQDERGIVVSAEQVPSETPAKIAGILAQMVNDKWMAEAFQASVKEASGALVIKTTDLVNHVRFRCSVAGTGGTAVEMDEF